MSGGPLSVSAGDNAPMWGGGDILPPIWAVFVPGAILGSIEAVCSDNKQHVSRLAAPTHPLT